MDFALSNKPNTTSIADAVNYLLANLNSNSLIYNSVTGAITSGGVVVGYLYRYLWVKYSTSFNGSTGFSNSPTNATYYGLRNSDTDIESTNPSDYTWTAQTFGTTNYFWYLATGGRTITIFVGTAAPTPSWSQDPGTAIDLDSVTSAKQMTNFPIGFGYDGEDGQDGMMIPTQTPNVFGEQTIINNGTGTVCTLQNTFYQVTAGWAAGDYKNTVLGASNITTSLGGNYYTVCSMSISSTSSNQVYNAQIFKNGSAIAAHNGTIKLVNSTDINSMTLTGVIANVVAGDVFDIRIQNTSSAAQTVTVQYSNFVIVRI